MWLGWNGTGILLPFRRLTHKEAMMTWITREHSKVDQIACPWRTVGVLDPTPEFLYVSADRIRPPESAGLRAIRCGLSAIVHDALDVSCQRGAEVGR